MINQNKKRGAFAFLIFSLALLALSGFVSASGVVSQYHRDSGDGALPLYLQPGESKDIQFFLQNGAGDNDSVTLRAQVVNGTDVATITDSDKDYLVPFMVKNPGVPVNVHIVAPSAALPGDSFNVRVSFTPVTAGEKGQFTLGSAFESSFDLVIAPKPSVSSSSSSASSSWVIYLIVAIVVILLVIFYLKNKNKN